MSTPANMALPPPGVDPSEWLQAQRQQQIAGFLTQDSLTPTQPQQIGKVASRTGLTPLLKLLEAYMGRKATDKSMSLNADSMAKALQAFQGSATTPGTPLQAPVSNPQQQTASLPQQHSGGSLSIPGIDPRTAMSLYMSNPAEYAKLKLGPDQVRLGTLAGMAPQDAAQSAFNKTNSIDLRSGGMVRLPNGQIIRAPNLPPGYEPEFDAQGNLTGTHPSPGLIPGEAQREAAVTAAKEANTPRMIPQGGGVESLGYPPTPPALRGQQASQPKQYFGAPPQVSMPTAPKPASTGMWAEVPKMEIPHTPGQTTDTFHQKLLDTAAAKHSELVNKYQQEADLADQKMQFNSQASQDLKNAEVGPMSDWLTNNRAKLQEMGIPDKLIPGSGTITPTLELNKYLKNSALQGARAIYGSRMTQTEVKLQTDEMSPSSHMTRDAISSLLQQDNIRNAYAKQRARDYGKYIQIGGDPTVFESWYSTRNPLTKYASHFNDDLSAEMRRRGLQ